MLGKRVTAFLALLATYALPVHLEGTIYQWIGPGQDITDPVNWGGTTPTIGDTGQFSGVGPMNTFLNFTSVSSVFETGTLDFPLQQMQLFSINGGGVPNTFIFRLSGQGIINLPNPQGIIFNIANFGEMEFKNSANTGIGFTSFSIFTNGKLRYLDSSAAGQSDYLLTGGSRLEYLNSADPGFSLISCQSGSVVNFDTSSGGSSNANLGLFNGGICEIRKSIHLAGISSDATSFVTFINPATLSTPNGLFGGPIIGPGSLDVEGSVFLNNTGNTYTGTTTVSSGTLTASPTALSPNSLITIFPSAQLTLGFGNGTYALPIVNNGEIKIDGSGIVTLSGAISGTGNFDVGGELTLQSINNTYSGGTTVGGILNTAVANLPPNDAIVTVGNGLVNFTTAGTETYNGVVSGSGKLAMSGAGVLTLAGLNTYAGGTFVNTGTLKTAFNTLPVAASQPSATVAAGATLEFVKTVEGTYSGNILLSGLTAELTTSGPSTLTLSGAITGTGSVDVPVGTLILTNSGNAYSGGTQVAPDATLVGSSESLQGAIVDDGTTIFNQLTSGTFAGTISSTTPNASLIKTGAGTLTFATNSGFFQGTTSVEEGIFRLNALLGGNIQVLDNGILKGTGTVGGSLLLVGGTVSPGNSIGTLTVNGDYVQSATSTYLVEINGAGASDEIVVHGNASLDGELLVLSLDGVVNESLSYLIMHVDGNFSGAFSSVTGTGYIAPFVLYQHNGDNTTDVFLNVKNIFTVIGKTFNQRQVGNQLASITNPNPELKAILDEIAALARDPNTFDQALKAYNQMTGMQYTTAWQQAELSGDTFLRHLYAPLRDRITSPYCACVCCCDDATVDTWAEVYGGQQSVSGNENSRGYTMEDYSVIFGAHGNLCNSLSLGLAGAYSRDITRYKVGGKGRNTTGFGALYALYRPCGWYLLGNLGFGYTQDTVNRPIHIGSLRYKPQGHPKLYQGLAYLEGGLDIQYGWALLQPYLGVQAGYFHQQAFTEHGGYPLNLHVKSKDVTPAYTRLGFHATTSGLSCASVSIDFGWQYRVSSIRNTIHEQFESFGTPFEIKGFTVHRSSLDATASCTALLTENCEAYIEATGAWWSRISGYSIGAGVKISW